MLEAPVIWSVPVRLALALAILLAAAAKLVDRRHAQSSLSTYGINQRAAQRGVWTALIVAELGLAVGLAAGEPLAAWGGLVLTGTGTATIAILLARGRGGRPCACFGARSRIGVPALIRNLVLAAGMAALLILPSYEPTIDEWQTIGLTAAIFACLALGLVVFALAREVGMLRMRLGPSDALEIPEEGPPLGRRSPIADRVHAADSDLRLAVFVSPTCRVCESLRPAIESIRGAERIAVTTFDEQADPDAWREAQVPGSPYAVALGRRGEVLAKGTFNNLSQLEGLVAVGFSRAGMAAGWEEVVHA